MPCVLVPDGNVPPGGPVPDAGGNVAEDDLGDVGGQGHHDGRLLQAVAVDAQQVLLHHKDADRVAPGVGCVLGRGEEEGEMGEDVAVGRGPDTRLLLHQPDVLPVQPQPHDKPPVL